MSVPSCPGCGGPMWVNRVVGLTVAHHGRCSVGDAEDVQQVCDYDLGDVGVTRTRRLTNAERSLLVAAGVEESKLRFTEVNVSFITPSLRRRVFTDVVVSSLPGMATAPPHIAG